MADLISVNVTGEEILAVIDKKQKRLVTLLESKMHQVVEETTELFLKELPGKYVDPKTIHFGVDRLTPTSIVGYIEATDKTGGYPIVPEKARALRFIAKSGDLVFTQFVFRPYLKGSKFVESHVLTLKPWIEEQLKGALNDL